MDMQKITKTKIWVRIAGNAANVRAGQPHGWRCFLKGTLPKKWSKEIPLVQWTLKGQATARNVIPGTDASGKTQQVVAWIDLYGDIVIENDVLRITLRDPE
ncbi:MAG: hypothetical protein A3C06_04055 [Candidatus Taylorbacteria bacterium RIFCSPHIGHO2_02_FULL_46_13]|uniref:Uncharacterized protein n=1 Tax=Candidatus Taylorbacteria bacterium RIFCSPHIGHO2_02_FULL_46_13 TaxID=1802312 RepID=A0A1G2MTN2_9BACT|nr:MAG: hypothetical protein A3C06_04055 [Candidatus Taylorbacteria bacterium RIFCSPHIGHO2_02_FULL_46_13]